MTAPSKNVLRINLLKSYLGLRDRTLQSVHANVSSHSDPIGPWLAARPFVRYSNVAALFHFPNALGLLDIVSGDGDWSQLRDLFRWFLAVAQECNKYINRAAGLAARLLLNGSGQVAGLYLSERLGKCVKTNVRNCADEVSRGS